MESKTPPHYEAAEPCLNVSPATKPISCRIPSHKTNCYNFTKYLL